jgi:hypothetical protein
MRLYWASNFFWRGRTGICDENCRSVIALYESTPPGRRLQPPFPAKFPNCSRNAAAAAADDDAEEDAGGG